MVKVVPCDERMNVSSVDHPNKGVKITFIGSLSNYYDDNFKKQ